jgi:hypothetical protein
VSGWAYPLDRGAMVLADLFDVFAAVNASKGHKPTPYPRPWESTRTAALGRGTSMTVEEYRALRARIEQEGSADG